MRFKRFDLNLLVVLETLLRERSVSRAAEQLNLSQPAISAALARLRQHFNDPILVPHGKRMVPTSHAQNLLPLALKTLADADELISASTVFAPATSQRKFRICGSDYVTTLLLVPLLQELARAAPNVRFEIVSPSPDSLIELERGKNDLVLAPEQYLAADHPKELLFDEEHVVVGCKKHPVFRAPLTEEAFFQQPHVAVVLSFAKTFAEEALDALGRKRRIEVTAPSFLAVPWLLPNTRRLAVMHGRLARLMATKLPLAVAPLPFTFPVMREMIQHHSARRGDGGLQWLRNRILERAAEFRTHPNAGRKKLRPRGA